MARISTSGEKKESNYSPEKAYSWKPEDIFELSGVQFSTLLNTLRTKVNVGAAPMAAIIECHSILESLLKAGVDSEVIKESSKNSESEKATAPIDGVPLP
jgi:hypothetical protein